MIQFYKTLNQSNLSSYYFLFLYSFFLGLWSVLSSLIALPLLPIKEYLFVKISRNSGATVISFSIVDLNYLFMFALYNILVTQWGINVFNTLKKKSLSFGSSLYYNSGQKLIRLFQVSSWSLSFMLLITLLGVNSS